jgi:sulfite reductase alpha subunit-like flavoprotein
MSETLGHQTVIHSMRQLLEEVLDIFSVPPRSFFEWLTYFATDPIEQEKLKELISKEGQVRF